MKLTKLEKWLWRDWKAANLVTLLVAYLEEHWKKTFWVGHSFFKPFLSCGGCEQFREHFFFQKHQTTDNSLFDKKSYWKYSYKWYLEIIVCFTKCTTYIFIRGPFSFMYMRCLLINRRQKHLEKKPLSQTPIYALIPPNQNSAEAKEVRCLAKCIGAECVRFIGRECVWCLKQVNIKGENLTKKYQDITQFSKMTMVNKVINT